MKRSNTMMSVAGGLFLCALLAGCGNRTPEEAAVISESFTREEIAGVVEAVLPTVDPVLDMATPEPTSSMVIYNDCGHELRGDGYAIVHTSRGDLLYQEQWMDFMRTAETAEGDGTAVRFETEVDGVTYCLFVVTIGEENGTYVGQVTDGDGVKQDVFVIVDELELGDNLTETEQHRLYAMQEDINCVIDTLN